MKLPEDFTRGLSAKDKQLAERVLEQAKKLMLVKIKKTRKAYKSKSFLATRVEMNSIYMVLDELEGELK